MQRRTRAATIAAVALGCLGLGTGVATAAPYVPDVSHVTAGASTAGETITVTLSNNIPAGFAPVACNYGLFPDGVVPTPGGAQAIPGTVRSAVLVTPGTSDSQIVTLPPGNYDLHFECVAEGVADNAEFDNLTTGPFFWGTQAVLDFYGNPGIGHPVVEVTVTEPQPDPGPTCFGSVCLP